MVAEARAEAARERTRGLLLDSALLLFARDGYERTTVRAIAREAGVAQGLLYNYFDGKEHLLRALFERSMAGVRESFAAGDDEADPRRRLASYIRACFRIVRRDLAFWRVSYGVRMQPAVVEGLGDALGGWTETIRATLEGYLRDAGVERPETEARLLFALIDGAAQHYALDPDGYPLDAVSDRIVARYAGSDA